MVLAVSVLDRLGIAMLRHHYRSPVVFPEDIRHPLSEPRQLPGLNLNVRGQLALIQRFNYRDELLEVPRQKTTETEFGYDNGQFESGDAEMLYNMIRHFKPRQIVEIGGGQSTLMALLAERQNYVDDPDNRCHHVCVEPYEHPWLDDIGVSIIRQPIELSETDLVTQLQANDLLFIDSSHVIRPQGDVLHEYLYLLGLLKPGVIVHAHDIFTPRDYPAEWVIERRYLWNEQYLLEAFLSFNKSFEVLAAVNYLAHEHRSELSRACPVFAEQPDREPGSFWFRKVH
jgi:predicted O-methyltransferase YrrM